MELVYDLLALLEQELVVLDTSVHSFIHDHLLACLGLLDGVVVERYDDLLVLFILVL